MMKKVTVFIFLVISLAGCSAVKPHESTLYDTYSEYNSKINKDNISEVAPNYFSENLLNEGDTTNPHLVDFFLFENSIASETSHYEKIENGRGCLTINGFDKKPQRVIFSLEYVYSEGSWLINSMHVIYSEQKAMEKAICPDEYGTL